MSPFTQLGYLWGADFGLDEGEKGKQDKRSTGDDLYAAGDKNGQESSVSQPVCFGSSLALVSL